MEINSDQSTFVLLSPVGSQLFTVVQRGHSLSVDKRSDVNFPIDPRRLYVDLQLMLWPRVQVEDPYVVKHELEADKDSTSKHVRWLVRSNKKFSKITATTFSGLKGKRVLKHYDGSYTLRLETFQVDYLEPGSTR